MLLADELDALVDPIVAFYEQYTQSVINDIARRLAGMDMTATAAWQMQRLTESGLVYENALDELARITGRSKKVLREAFEKAGVQSIAFDDAIYTEAGLNPLPLNLSPAMAQVLAAGLNKTQGVITNLTMTTASSGQQAFISAADLAYMQVANGAMSYDQAIRAAIKQVAQDGLSVIFYPTGKADQLDVAMRRTVLTGVSQTTGVMQIERMNEMGVDLVQTSAHIGARPAHQVWQGKIFSRSGRDGRYPDFVAETGYGTGPGLMGWNCVVGETVVSGSNASLAYRREYSGEVIVIRTASGNELTITPNHPILTTNGWVAAGLLRKGDNVISRRLSDGIVDARPNNNKKPTLIKDVFCSLAENGKRVVFFGSPEDFHGDGADGKVDIVFSDSLLRDDVNSALFHDFEEVGFGFSSCLSNPLVAESAFSEVCISPLHSPDGAVGTPCQFGSPILPKPFHPNSDGFGFCFCNRKPKFCKSFSDNRVCTSEPDRNFFFGQSALIEPDNLVLVENKPPVPLRITAGKFLESEFIQTNPNYFLTALEMTGDVAFTHPALVKPDEIIFIQRKFMVTHVYNLETDTGWYYSNGIVTHNCRHSFYPFFDGLSHNAYKKRELESFANATRTYQGKEISVYDATQIQRGIERKIRFWKRQASAFNAASLDNTREIAKIRLYQAKMRAFIKQTKLSRQYVRESVVKP
ncbi:MAG: hypothetical protein HY865_22120 [Chloroflexi bacterium]|nr:hypothetical protein [Chloroflexota bacterium]